MDELSRQNLIANGDDAVDDDDIAKLYYLCAEVSDSLFDGGDEDPWEHVREWLETHSEEELQDSAMVQGSPRNQTPLHVVCDSGAPFDIVRKILDAAPVAAQLIDTQGRLPLHYAAQYSPDDRILKILTEAYPLATQTGDYKMKVPLHFALESRSTETSVTCATILSAGKANSCKQTDDGTLPMHFACAYGASVDVLEVLADAYEEPLDLAKDKRGMTPLHYICGNPFNPFAPFAAEFIIELAPQSVNVRDRNSSLPLKHLATKGSSSDPNLEEFGDNLYKILEIYLRAKPIPSADFLTALQALPEWLRDRAVTTPSVQELLNQKIAMRLPTAIMICDFLFYIIIISSFSIGVTCTIKNRMPGSEEGCDRQVSNWILLVSVFYFLIREIVQVLSLLSLGLIKSYFSGGTNYIDILALILGFFFFIDMQTEKGIGKICKGNDEECLIEKLDTFRWVASIALLVFWAAMLSFLKSTFIEFAVFVGGLRNVVGRFIPFLMALLILLIAFQQIFYLIYFDSQRCQCTKVDADKDFCDVEYPDGADPHFCEEWLTLLKVYIMLLGEVNDEEFLVNNFQEEGFVQGLGITFFIIFMFLVVILLANVLIAIVTDSYGVIKNERAAVVFWTNRLDYIAECDAIIHGPWIRRMRELFFLTPNDAVDNEKISEEFGAELWETCIGFDVVDYKVTTIDFWAFLFFRILAFAFVLVWVPVGFLTFGTLWPPQVRERLLFSDPKSGGGEGKELEKRSMEVRSLREEVRDLQNEILLEMSTDRKEVVAMKNQFVDMKKNLQTEMRSIKQIVTMLFDLQSLDGN